MESAISDVNLAVESDSSDHTLMALQNEHLDLSDVDPINAQYYHEGLLNKKRGKPNGRLTEEEIQECVREMNARANLDRLGKVVSKLKTALCTVYYMISKRIRFCTILQ